MQKNKMLYKIITAKW